MKDRFNIDGHKLQYHLDRVLAWERGEEVYPIYVEISPVDRCNHSCTFCALDFARKGENELSSAVLKRTIKEMASLGVKSIMFAGEGEPLLHPNLANLVNFTAEQGIDVAITTNGTQLTDKFINDCLHNITWIKFSVNAGDVRTYAKIHRCSEVQWKRVWENIRKVIEARGEAEENKTTVGIQSILLPDNAHTMATLAYKARKARVDYFVVKPYSHNPASVTREYVDLVYGDRFDKYMEALGMWEGEGFKVIARSCEQGRSYERCLSVPYFWAYVMASGDVYGCSAHLENKKFHYGNIGGDSFRYIWDNRGLKGFKMKSFDIAQCRKNCRMDKINQYLWELKNPCEHRNFI